MKLAIYLITSVLIMAAGIFMIISDKKRRKGCTATATATVVDIKTEIEHDAGSTGSDTTKYITVLKFCAGGNQVVAQGNCSSLKRDKYTVGERIEIIYNPDNPTVLFMDTQANFNRFGLLVTIIGLGMFIYNIIFKSGLI